MWSDAGGIAWAGRSAAPLRWGPVVRGKGRTQPRGTSTLIPRTRSTRATPFSVATLALPLARNEVLVRTPLVWTFRESYRLRLFLIQTAFFDSKDFPGIPQKSQFDRIRVTGRTCFYSELVPVRSD